MVQLLRVGKFINTPIGDEGIVPPPADAPTADFSIATNSQLIAVLLEDF